MIRKVTVNGREVVVSEEIFQAILENDNPENYYNSSSQGKILLSDMADEHLKNAFLKILRNLFTDKLESMKTESLEELTKDGIISVKFPDDEIEKLFKEMQRRVKNEKNFNALFSEFFVK